MAIEEAMARAKLGAVEVGEGLPVRVMAAINVSPESFYKGSVATTAEDISTRALDAVEEGADIIDVGGMSTAPYLKAEVTKELETSRVLAALHAIAAVLGEGEVTVSVDTVRGGVADVALRNGATVVNDVSGLKNDPRMARVVRERGASLLAMAHSTRASALAPVKRVSAALEETLAIADRAGIDHGRIALDPGIGFFRNEAGTKTSSQQKLMPWYEWDCQVISGLRGLRRLGRPIAVGVSRKSFIGKILGLDEPEERLPASLAVTAVCVMNGADLVRTHDVRETLYAARVATALREAGLAKGRPS